MSSAELSSLEISTSNRRRIENDSENNSQSQFLIFDPALKDTTPKQIPLQTEVISNSKPNSQLYKIVLPSTGETVHFTKAEFIAYHLALNNSP